MMGGTKLACIAHDLESRILQPLLSHQREAQKRNTGVDLHLQTADGRGVDLHQVMVLPRSGMLRSLRVTLVETSLTLLLPDTSYDTLQVLVPLLYGSKLTISVEAYSALSSVCAALDLHDWLQQEKTEEEMKVEEQLPEILRKGVVRARIETNYVENSAKNTNSRSDGLKCEICGKKYQDAARLHRHYNAVHFKGDSSPQAPTIKPSTWLKQSHARETCQVSDHCPSSKSSPVKLRPSKMSLRPCHTLRNGGNNFSGERGHRGSTLSPWKYDKVEEGCDIFRWQYTCFNRRLCQYRGLSPKQKQFCSLWNTFLWAEVLPGLGKLHVIATLKAFYEKKKMKLKALNLYSEAIVHVVALEQEGLLSQSSAETALKLLRKTQFP